MQNYSKSAYKSLWSNNIEYWLVYTAKEGAITYLTEKDFLQIIKGTLNFIAVFQQLHLRIFLRKTPFWKKKQNIPSLETKFACEITQTL